MVLNPTIVVDLDGTLANIDHRLNLIKRKNKWFDRFFDLCHKDKPNEWCVRLIQAAVLAGWEVKIVSARPVRLFVKTGEWLIRSGIPSQNVELVLLRGDKDFSKDVDLKRNWLRRSRILKESILFVVDDRQRVVDMWREEGLVCLQCFAWEEFNVETKNKDNVGTDAGQKRTNALCSGTPPPGPGTKPSKRIAPKASKN